MAAAAGMEESVSPSVFMEVKDLEVEGGVIRHGLIWTEDVWMNRWRREQQKASREQIFEVQTWKHVRGPARAVMCDLCFPVECSVCHTARSKECGREIVT